MSVVPHVLNLALLALLLAAGWARGDWFARNLRHAGLLQGSALVSAAVLVPANLHALTLPAYSPVAAGIAAATIVVLVVLIGSAALLRIHGQPDDQPRRILAVGAHPDDLELACGGTLAKFVDAGHEVHAVIMSRGAAGGEQERRAAEARSGAIFLGARTVTVHDFPDTALHGAGHGLVAAIESAIERLTPDVILTHSAHDQHQDHAAVHAATLRAARQQHSILCFESPSVTRDFNPSVFIDIGEYVDVKVQAVRMHRDQAGKPYMSGQRLRGLATFRGAQAKRSYAEGFEPVRMLGLTGGEL